MARRFPDDIRQIVTLGSPFGATDEGSTNPMVLRMFEQLSGLSVEEMRAQMVHDADPTEPVGVPCTAIYSRTDGVVQWQTCLEHDTPLTENIEVVGSHTGMAFNPVIYALLTERLSQPLREWKKFDRTAWPWLSMFLPRFVTEVRTGRAIPPFGRSETLDRLCVLRYNPANDCINRYQRREDDRRGATRARSVGQ